MGVVRELWPHSHEGRCDACRRAWFGAPLRLRTLEDFESKKPAVEEVSRSQRIFRRVAPSLLPFCICRVFCTNSEFSAQGSGTLRERSPYPANLTNALVLHEIHDMPSLLLCLPTRCCRW
jgi:hypothetical protein